MGPNFVECFPGGRSLSGAQILRNVFQEGDPLSGAQISHNVFPKGDPLSGAQIPERVSPKGDPLSDNQGYVPPLAYSQGLAHNQGLGLLGPSWGPIGPFVGVKGSTRALFSGLCTPVLSMLCTPSSLR